MDDIEVKTKELAKSKQGNTSAGNWQALSEVLLLSC